MADNQQNQFNGIPLQTMRPIGIHAEETNKIPFKVDFDGTGREVSDIIFCRIRDVESPNRAHMTDAGADFFVPKFDDSFMEEFRNQNPDTKVFINREEGIITIPAHGSLKIPSGIRVYICNPATYLWLDDKSGVAGNKHLKLGANCVDCGYTGEIIINLFNFDTDVTYIKEGQKLVQGIQQHYIATNYKEATLKDFEKIANTPRGSGKFGSTEHMRGN